MDTLKKAAELASRCRAALVRFALLFKSVTALGLAALLWVLLRAALARSGEMPLTVRGALAAARSPFALGAGALVLLLLALAAMTEAAAVLFLFDCAARRERAGVWQVLRFALGNTLRALRPKNVAFLPLFMLFLLSLLPIFAPLLLLPAWPEELWAAVAAHPLPLVSVCGALLALGAALDRRVYAFVYFTLEGASFAEGRAKGAARHGDGAALLGARLLYALGGLVCAALVSAAAVGAYRLLALCCTPPLLLFSAVRYALAIALVLFAALLLPLWWGCVSVRFYQRKMESGEQLVHAAIPPARRSFLRAFALVVLTAAALAGCLYGGFLTLSGRLDPLREYRFTPSLTAHRGAARCYPENTMAAFRGAWEQGADWLELDVQQSRDGKLIVLHDATFRRTAGRDASPAELDYADIARLDAGSSFSPAFAGERVPTLEEVLAFAEEKGLRLNIELKSAARREGFERAVIDAVRDAGMMDRCLLASLDYRVLERIKACDPAVPTLFVMSEIYDEPARFPAADHFSLRAAALTEDFAAKVQGEGRSLFVWEADTADVIDAMLALRVDGVITNDIPLARSRLQRPACSPLFARWLNVLGAANVNRKTRKK